MINENPFLLSSLVLGETIIDKQLEILFACMLVTQNITSTTSIICTWCFGCALLLTFLKFYFCRTLKCQFLSAIIATDV